MFEKLANYAAKQLELDIAEITPDASHKVIAVVELDAAGLHAGKDAK